jgi:hypothetical protein
LACPKCNDKFQSFGVWMIFGWLVNN